jgi:hypothetical protein
MERTEDHYVKRNKPGTGRQIPHLTYLWNQEELMWKLKVERWLPENEKIGGMGKGWIKSIK